MMIGLFLLVPLALILLGMGVAGALLVRAGRRGRAWGIIPSAGGAGSTCSGSPKTARSAQSAAGT
jgi:hypothetical protein